MKTNTLKEILLLAAIAGIAFYISRNYRKKKQKEKDML